MTLTFLDFLTENIFGASNPASVSVELTLPNISQCSSYVISSR